MWNYKGVDIGYFKLALPTKDAITFTNIVHIHIIIYHLKKKKILKVRCMFSVAFPLTYFIFINIFLLLSRASSCKNSIITNYNFKTKLYISFVVFSIF